MKSEIDETECPSGLQPCPFCGGSEKYLPKAVLLEVPWAKPAWTVECDNCQASCGYEGTRQDAINAWNDRH